MVKREYSPPQWRTCDCDTCKKAREVYDSLAPVTMNAEEADEAHKKWFSGETREAMRVHYEEEYSYTNRRKRHR